MWPRLTFQSETRSLCVCFTFSFTVNTSLTLPASCYYCCQHAGRAVLVHSGAEKSPGRGPTTRVWGKKTLKWAFRTPEVARREAALWMHVFQFLAQSSATITLYSKECFSSERCTKDDCCLCTALIHVSFVSSGPPCMCQWKLRRTAWTGGGGLQLKQRKQHAPCQICRWMCRQVSAEPDDAEVSWLWHQITVQHQLSAGF